jgi:hypothetical protein
LRFVAKSEKVPAVLGPFRFFGPALAVVSWTALAGCSDVLGTTTNTTTATSADAVILDAETVTAGRGCSAAKGAVYKYGVAMTFAPRSDETPTNRAAQAGIFDCFADGNFLVGEAPIFGEEDVILQVFAWDADGYAAQKTAIEQATAAADDAATRWGTTAPTARYRCTATRVAGLESRPICTPVAAPTP